MLHEDEDTSHVHKQIASPYGNFVHKNRNLIETQNPNLTSADIAIKLAVMWANMSDEQRSVYIKDSNSKHFSFSFPEETEKLKKGETFESQLTESIANAASQISQFESPTDPDNYLIWLGSKVVSKFYQAHGNITAELIELFKNGQFLTNKPLLNQTEIENQLKDLFPMLLNQIPSQ